uniref:Uncharacterized protein LOC116947802 n=1 Tax=Petromyzon marinus TaxID=7757 RepID=A0AAJ7TL28_PETMA|nr:uncharacterized protein LOC116947802 [Petromyzon marinus]XP_032819853.1 uncharacterized protein LOC116947802 [Petromyzon marinus]
MPVKAPMYLKAPPNKKGKKPRLRDILSPDMISPPLGDFRHLMHIGGSAMDDYDNDSGNHGAPDHRVNHQGNHIHQDLHYNHQQQQQQQINNLLHQHHQQQQQINNLLHQHHHHQQQQPVLKTGRSPGCSASCLDAMRSPVLKNALTLPFTGSPRALDLPYLSPHYAPTEASSPTWPPGGCNSIAVAAPPQSDSSSRGTAPKDGGLRKQQSGGSVGGGSCRWSNDGTLCDEQAEEYEDLDVFAEADGDLVVKPWLRHQASISRSLSVPVHGGHSVSPSSFCSSAGGGAGGGAAAAASTGRVFSVPSLAHTNTPNHHRLSSTLTREVSAGESIGQTRSGQRSNRFLQTMLVNAKLSKLFHHSSKNNVGDGTPGGAGGGDDFGDGAGGAGLSGQKTNSTTRLWNRFSFSRGRDGGGGGGSGSSTAVKSRSSPVKAMQLYPETSTLGRDRTHEAGKPPFSGCQNQRGRLVEPSSRYSWSGSLQRDFGNIFPKAPFTAGRTSPGGDGIAGTLVDGSMVVAATGSSLSSLLSSPAVASAALSTSQPLLSGTPAAPSSSPLVVVPPQPLPQSAASPSVAPPLPAVAISTSQPSLSGTPSFAPSPSPPCGASPPLYAVAPSSASAEPPPAPLLSSSSSSSLSSSAARQPLARSLFQRSRSQIAAVFRSGIFHSKRHSSNPTGSEEVVFPNRTSQTQDRLLVSPTRHPCAESRNGVAQFVPVAPVDCAIDQTGVQECFKGATRDEHFQQRANDALEYEDVGETAMQHQPRDHHQQEHHHHHHQNRQSHQHHRQQQQQEFNQHYHQQHHQQQHTDHHQQQQHQAHDQPSTIRRCSSKDSLDPFHLSGSLLSLGLDLGPSLLVDVLGVMDKPQVPSVGDPTSREPADRNQSSPERDSGVGCSDGDLPHAETPSRQPRLN